MRIAYNQEKKGWQIVNSVNHFTKPECWGKPIIATVFKTWDDACAVLDQWGY